MTVYQFVLGDVRITAVTDEWVFSDPEILSLVISPAVRMAMKLHQDHFLLLDDFEDSQMLYERIQDYQSGIYISHEVHRNMQKQINFIISA